MTLKKWIDGYVRAWRTNAPDDIRALFTDDARYYTAPFRPPWDGIEEIVEGWLDRQDEPGGYTFEWSPVVETDELGIVQGLTTYPDETFSNLWVIRFASTRTFTRPPANTTEPPREKSKSPGGRATEFTEWFMEHTRATDD